MSHLRDLLHIQTKQPQVKQQNNLQTKLMPLVVQIGQKQLNIIPQYPSTQMKLIQQLVRCLDTDIPQSQALHLVNWTKGRKIGKAIEPQQTLQSLLQQAEQSVPKIRVYYQNCPKYYVRIDLHDILILDYSNVDKFQQMIDILNFVKADVIKTFKLEKSIEFALRFDKQYAHAKKLAFVGRYLVRDQINNIKIMLSFRQNLSTQFVKEKCPGTYQQLICPISQLIMQDPIITSCRHTFDKLCISMAIMKDNKCPVCRHHLQLKDLKPAKKLKIELRNLKTLRYLDKMTMKKQEQEQ